MLAALAAVAGCAAAVPVGPDCEGLGAIGIQRPYSADDIRALNDMGLARCLGPEDRLPTGQATI